MVLDGAMQVRRAESVLWTLAKQHLRECGETGAEAEMEIGQWGGGRLRTVRVLSSNRGSTMPVYASRKGSSTASASSSSERVTQPTWK